METQSDLFEREDALLAERIMRLGIGKQLQGMFRTSTSLVNSPLVAEMMVAEVGARNIIEFSATTLEREIANKKG